MKRKRIFIDMDGVLCRYRELDDLSELEKPGYFASLPPCRKVVKAVKALIRSGRADVYILSAVLPRCAETSKAEKNQWLDRFLPEIGPSHRIFTICGENKADAVHGISTDDLLLDDHSPNLKNWVRSGGRGIKILNGINGKNGTFTEGPRVKIEKKADLLKAVEKACFKCPA